MDSDVENADSKLYVEFYTHERKPHVGQPFVRIMVPGDKTNILDQPVREDHKQRFPRQWLHFQMQNGDSQAIGTPLKDWAAERPDDLDSNIAAELTILKFQTAEQVATMSDAQAQKVGMAGLPLREKARQYLLTKNQKASSGELEATKAALAATNAKLEEMQVQMAAIIAGQTKSKGGRPRNAPVEA